MVDLTIQSKQSAMDIGWFAVVGWQTTFAACAFLAGTMIQGAAILGSSVYHSISWHGTMLTWASIACALVANIAGGNVLPRIETVILVMHILGFFGIVIPLVYMADHKSKEEVFLQFHNSGGFPTQGLSWFIGMTSCAFAFAGGDAAVHVSLIIVPFVESMLIQTTRWRKRLKVHRV